MTRATTAGADEGVAVGGGSGGGVGSGTKARKAPAAPPPLPAWSDAGCAFFAGGPIWALDWCPESKRKNDAGEEEEEEDEEEEEEEDEEGANRSRRRTRRLLAVSAHPPASATTAIGERLAGPALVQIWSVPKYCAIFGGSGGGRRAGKRPKLAAGAEETTALPPPAIAFALAHGGCLARDLKWRPPGNLSPFSDDESRVVGILAAALGDGSLTIWSVPSEAAVRRKLLKGKGSSAANPPPSSNPAAAAAAVVVDLAPLAVGTGCGLLSAVAWCPQRGNGKGKRGGASGGEELATAGFDGSAVLWRVEAATSGDGDDGSPFSPSSSSRSSAARLVPLLRTPRDAGGPLRCLAFPPSPGIALSHAAGLASSSSSSSSPSFSSPRLRAFATAGHSPDARLWDASDPGGGCLLARLPLAASRAWCLSLAWLAVPLGLLVAQDGGRLLFLPLDGGSGGGGGGGGAEAATAAAAPSEGNKKRGGALNNSNKKKKKSPQKQQQQQQQQQQRDLCLCRVAGGAEARDDAVWGVSACPGTATLAAYCTGGGFVGTVDVLPTPAAREAARRLAAASGSGGGGGGGSRAGGGGAGGNQAVVSGFVPASAVLSSGFSSSSSGSFSINAAAVALPLTSEMRALAARAERAAEAEAAAQQRADAAAAAAAGAVPRGGGRAPRAAAAAPTTTSPGGGGAEQGQNPPPRPAYALRDARLSVNRVEFSQLEYSHNSSSSKAWWSALAAGGGLGVVRVHELDVERVARGRV